MDDGGYLKGEQAVDSDTFDHLATLILRYAAWCIFCLADSVR